MIDNIIDCYKHVPYTWKHYLAFLKLERSLLGYYKYKFHDLDKLFWYIFFPFLGTKRIKKIHQKFNKHHIQYNKFICNYEEAVIDWECARFTKADKQRTARQTLTDGGENKYGIHYRRMMCQLDMLALSV